MELPPLLEAFPKTGRLEEIETYLAERSNLPGPRADLELSEAFARQSGEWERTGRRRPGTFAPDLRGSPEAERGKTLLASSSFSAGPRRGRSGGKSLGEAAA
jgi:hypothetical protein